MPDVVDLDSIDLDERKPASVVDLDVVDLDANPETSRAGAIEESMSKLEATGGIPRRKKKTDKWMFPGGDIQKKEALEKAAKHLEDVGFYGLAQEALGTPAHLLSRATEKATAAVGLNEGKGYTAGDVGKAAIKYGAGAIPTAVAAVGGKVIDALPEGRIKRYAQIAPAVTDELETVAGQMGVDPVLYLLPAKRAVAAFFIPGAIKDAATQFPEAYKLYLEAGEQVTPDVARAVVRGVFSTTMAATMGAHLGGGVPEGPLNPRLGAERPAGGPVPESVPLTDETGYTQLYETDPSVPLPAPRLAPPRPQGLPTETVPGELSPAAAAVARNEGAVVAPEQISQRPPINAELMRQLDQQRQQAPLISAIERSTLSPERLAEMEAAFQQRRTVEQAQEQLPIERGIPDEAPTMPQDAPGGRTGDTPMPAVAAERQAPNADGLDAVLTQLRTAERPGRILVKGKNGVEAGVATPSIREDIGLGGITETKAEITRAVEQARAGKATEKQQALYDRIVESVQDHQAEVYERRATPREEAAAVEPPPSVDQTPAGAQVRIPGTSRPESAPKIRTEGQIPGDNGAQRGMFDAGARALETEAKAQLPLAEAERRAPSEPGPRERRGDAELRQAFEQLQPEEKFNKAYRDKVSGIANRRAFDEAHDAHVDKGGHVLTFDLSGFKEINDTHGHAAGDVALRFIADKLQAAGDKHGASMVARLGGDEFGALIESPAQGEALGRAMQEGGAHFKIVTEDGQVVTIKAPSVDYAVARKLNEADAKLLERRAAAEAAGTRKTRGQRELEKLSVDQLEAELRARRGVEPRAVPKPVERTGGEGPSGVGRRDVGRVAEKARVDQPSQGRAFSATEADTAAARELPERQEAARPGDVVGREVGGQGPPRPPRSTERTPPSSSPIDPTSNGSRASALARIGRAIRDPLLPFVTRVEEMGKPGKVLRRLVDSYEHMWETTSGRASKEVLDAVHSLGVGVKERQRTFERDVVPMLEGEKPIDATPAGRAAERLKSMLDEIAAEADKRGVLVKYREGYFPHLAKDMTFLDFENRVRRLMDADRKLTPEQAAEQINSEHYTKPPARIEGTLERERTGNLEDYRKDPKVLLDYVLHATRRIAEAEHFGKRHEIVRGVMDQLSDQKHARLLPSDRAYVEQGIERITGLERRGLAHTASEIVRGAGSVVKLGLAPLSQLGSLAQTAGSTSVRDAALGAWRSIAGKDGVRGLKDIRENWRKAKLDATEAGALFSNLSSELAHTLGNESLVQHVPWLKATNWVDGAQRVVAFQAAKTFLPRMLKEAKAGKLKSQAALRDLGVDWRTADAKDADVVSRAGKKIADTSQFRTGISQLPLWASSPWGRVAFQFQTFMYQHTRFVAGALREAQAGRPGKLIRMAVVGAVLGEGIEDAKNVIKGYGIVGEDPKSWHDFFGSKRIKATDAKSAVLRAAQNMAAVGGIGVYQSALQKTESRDPLLETALGPSYQEVTDARQIAGSALKGDFPKAAKQAGKAAVQRIPIFGREVAREFMNEEKPAKPGTVGQIHDYAKGEVSGKDAARGIVLGDRRSPDREALARRETLSLERREIEKQIKEGGGTKPEEPKPTSVERMGAEERKVERGKIVLKIQAELKAGHRGAAFALARKAHRAHLGSINVRNIEAALQQRAAVGP